MYRLLSAQTLDELHDRSDTPMLLSLTVRSSTIRLLDNMLLPSKLNTITGLTNHLGIS